MPFSSLFRYIRYHVGECSSAPWLPGSHWLPLDTMTSHQPAFARVGPTLDSAGLTSLHYLCLSMAISRRFHTRSCLDQGELQLSSSRALSLKGAMLAGDSVAANEESTAK